MILAGVRPFVVNLPTGWLGWQAVQSLLSIGCNTLLLATVYRVLPQESVPWKAALGGGLVTAIVWAIGRSVLLSFVVGDQYSAYGHMIGAIMGVMFWFYYASAVVFLGPSSCGGIPREPIQLTKPNARRFTDLTASPNRRQRINREKVRDTAFPGAENGKTVPVATNRGLW